MSGPTREADFADLVDDPVPAHVAPEPRPGAPLQGHSHSVEIAQVRMVHGAAAMLALSVLADSGIEHSRGQYHNPAMFTPLVSSTPSTLARVDGAARSEKTAHPLRLASSGVAMVVGLVGTAFHVYNITKKPGDLSWENLFYQAPIGAPAALSLSGLLGLAAEDIRDETPGESPKLLGLLAAPALAGLTALGLVGTTAEVTLLRFRGNFQNKLMYLPVLLPPIAAALAAGGGAEAGPPPAAPGEAVARHHGGARWRDGVFEAMAPLPTDGGVVEPAEQAQARRKGPRCPTEAAAGRPGRDRSRRHPAHRRWFRL